MCWHKYGNWRETSRFTGQITCDEEGLIYRTKIFENIRACIKCGCLEVDEKFRRENIPTKTYLDIGLNKLLYD